MHLIKNWPFFFFLLIFPFWMSGQSMVKIDKILASAQHDLAVHYQQNHVNFTEKNLKNLPFAEQISLRSETDRFSAARQEYLARLTVNGISEMNWQKKYNSASLKTEENQQRLFLHDALVDRYLAIVNYRFALASMEIQNELQDVYDDKVQVLNKMASLTTDADIDELIKVEYDRDELSLDIVSLKSQLSTLQQSMTYWMQDSIAWQLDTTGFIRTTQIPIVIDQLNVSGAVNPHIQEKELERAQLQTEYYLERASGRQMLDFFQLRYANRPENDFSREFSVGFGINLPYRGSSRVKMGEIDIDIDNAAHEAFLYRMRLTELITEARQKILDLQAQLSIAKSQWEDSQAKFSLESTGLRVEGPMPLLRARELQLKRQLNQLEIEHEIIEQYINILDWSGSISAVPYVNYLSEELNTY
jgi:hypothetical protein